MAHDPDSWWLDERAHAGREHFDEQHARRYDAKMDAEAAAEVRLLQEAGVLDRTCAVVDIGAGTGQFALAAARVCARVVAVDVSPVMLAGGVLRLWDVVYSFEPADAERRIEAWITETMSTDVERGWTRAEFAEHVRDEHSTYTWLLEPAIEHAGFDIVDASYSASAVFARYLCRKR